MLLHAQRAPSNESDFSLSERKNYKKCFPLKYLLFLKKFSLAYESIHPPDFLKFNSSCIKMSSCLGFRCFHLFTINFSPVIFHNLHHQLSSFESVFGCSCFL